MKAKTKIEIEIEQLARTIVKEQTYLRAGDIFIERIKDNSEYDYEQYNELFKAININATLNRNNYTNKTKNLSYEEKLIIINNNDLNIEYQNPSEFWLVSEWLYENLKGLGEATTELDIYCIWGRTSSCHPISNDSVIKQIAKSLYESNIK